MCNLSVRDSTMGRARCFVLAAIFPVFENAKFDCWMTTMTVTMDEKEIKKSDHLKLSERGRISRDHNWEHNFVRDLTFEIVKCS
jgi:hypothetical protein